MLYATGRNPKNVFNQYGFALGGPIWIPKIVNGKNKLFFFLDYQGTKRRQYAAAPNLTLPTAAMRTGDFGATGTTIYDPLTGNPDGTGRTPFVGNVVPSNRGSGCPSFPTWPSWRWDSSATSSTLGANACVSFSTMRSRVAILFCP